MGGIPFISLRGQEPHKRVTENANPNPHLIWTGMGQRHGSTE